MNSQLMEKARELAARNYSLAVYNNEGTSGDAGFLAKNPELHGCVAQGATLEEAVVRLAEARVDYIYSLLEDGLAVPNPAPEAAAPEVTLTDDTDSYAQFTVKKTVPFQSQEDAAAPVVDRKPLYEASLTT